MFSYIKSQFTGIKTSPISSRSNHLHDVTDRSPHSRSDINSTESIDMKEEDYPLRPVSDEESNNSGICENSMIISSTSFHLSNSTESIDMKEQDYPLCPNSDEENTNSGICENSMIISSTFNHGNEVLSNVLSSVKYKFTTKEENFKLAREILSDWSCDPLKTNLLSEVNIEDFSKENWEELRTLLVARFSFFQKRPFGKTGKKHATLLKGNNFFSAF
jgi:hypothetical protein